MVAKKKEPKTSDNKEKNIENKEKKINNPQGRGADKLKLDLNFNDAIKRAVNTRIKKGESG